MRNLQVTGPGLGQGIYTRAEASRLLKMPPDMVKRWTQGYTKLRGEDYRSVGPVIAQPPSSGGLLSFLDLIELFSVREFKQAGMQLPKIREAHEVLREQFQTPYPFATQRFATDGKQILDTRNLEDPLTRQRAFEFVREFFRNIRFGPDDLSDLWWPLGPDHLIVVDPKRSFGAPIDTRSGIRTEILYRAYLAEGENADAVAAWYEVSPEVVEEAVVFERSLAA
ncbi:MAG TPA: hypothetical protein VM328_08885 [Fimbriimonadaceae bacterium]|nr:hypothetical protein [Fimbriimonadaceae bacterium]